MSMKRLGNIIYKASGTFASMLALTVVLTGCSADETQSVAEKAHMPIVFNAQIGTGAAHAASDGTRATADNDGNAWDGGEYTMIHLADLSTFQSEHPEKSLQYNVGADKKSLSPNASGVNDRFYWQPTPDKYNLTAWSFGNNTDALSTASPASFAVDADQSTKNKELLYAAQVIQASKTSDANYNAIDVKFYHQLAQVKIKITYTGLSTTTGAVVTGWDHVVSVRYGKDNDQIVLAGDFVAPSVPTDADPSLSPYGTWTPTTTSKGIITPKQVGTKTATSGADAVSNEFTEWYSAVVIPSQTYAKDFTLFDITMDTKNGTTDVQKKFIYQLQNDFTFDPGKSYTFNVNVTDVNVNLVGIDIADWTGYTQTIGFE